MKNKKGTTTMSLIAGFVIGGALFFFVISWIFYDLDPITMAKIIIPDLKPSEHFPTNESTGLECPILVAKVADNVVYLCNEPDCATQSTTKILVEEETVEVDQVSNEVIGTITLEKFIYIKKDLINAFLTENSRNYDLYEEVKDDIIVDELIALDNSYFLNSAKDTICTNELKTIDDYRLENYDAVIREKFIEGIRFFYNIDELIKNVNEKSTPLYLDSELKTKANSLIKASGKTVLRQQEVYDSTEMEPHEVAANLFDTSTQDLNFYTSESKLVEGVATPIYPLATALENPDDEIGVDSNEDSFTHVQYIKWNGEVYVRFYEYDGSNTETPYIRMEYWNAYRTFNGAPNWAIIPEDWGANQ